MKHPHAGSFAIVKATEDMNFLAVVAGRNTVVPHTLLVVSFFQSSYFLERSMTWRTTYASAARRAIAPTAAKRRGRYKAPLAPVMVTSVQILQNFCIYPDGCSKRKAVCSCSGSTLHCKHAVVDV